MDRSKSREKRWNVLGNRLKVALGVGYSYRNSLCSGRWKKQTKFNPFSMITLAGSVHVLQR